jgi:glycosyltransferase involved in cell wall biosynthesis
MSFAQTHTPEISVIVPVHNGAAFLHGCLEAIFASSGVSYECIVVNDASTDHGPAIARRFAARIVDLPEGPRGPAYARNRGAEAACGTILMFVDADVVLAPGAVERVANSFRNKAGFTAVFGSYDALPRAPGVISQYRNLLHHFVHQNGNAEASTFWAGCGAIRRSAFKAIGGFDEKRFPRPSIEDIELGYRLRAAGHQIRLDKELQGTHLKQWGFCSLLRTDITCRALPWSRLILETRNMPDDLNLRWVQRASFLLTALACVFLILSTVRPQWLVMTAVALCGVVVLNRKLYGFFLRQRGLLFAVACIPLHLLYYLYSGFSYIYAWAGQWLSRLAAVRRGFAWKTAVSSFKNQKP